MMKPLKIAVTTDLYVCVKSGCVDERVVLCGRCNECVQRSFRAVPWNTVGEWLYISVNCTLHQLYHST